MCVCVCVCIELMSTIILSIHELDVRLVVLVLLWYCSSSCGCCCCSTSCVDSTVRPSGSYRGIARVGVVVATVATTPYCRAKLRARARAERRFLLRWICKQSHSTSTGSPPKQKLDTPEKFYFLVLQSILTA